MEKYGVVTDETPEDWEKTAEGDNAASRLTDEARRRLRARNVEKEAERRLDEEGGVDAG